MTNRDEKVAYLESMHGVRARLEAIGATSGPDWDDLLWARAECRRLEADLSSGGSVHIGPLTGAATSPKKAATSRALGRPNRPADEATLARVYRDGLRRNGMPLPKHATAGMPLMPTILMLATAALSPRMAALIERALVAK